MEKRSVQSKRRKTPARSPNKAESKDVVGYPVRIFFDKYTPADEETLEYGLYMAVPGVGDFDTNPAVHDLNTGEVFPLFRGGELLGDSTAVFYSQDRKSFFIFRDDESTFFRFDSETYEQIDTFRFYYFEGEEGSDPKPFGDKILGVFRQIERGGPESHLLIYYQNEKKTIGRTNVEPDVFTSYRPDRGEILVLEGTDLIIYNVATRERELVANFKNFFPPREGVRNMQAIGDIVFFTSRYSTILWNMKKREKIRTLKFKIINEVFELPGKKVLMYFESKGEESKSEGKSSIKPGKREKKGFFLGILSLSGKILKTRKVYRGHLAKCRDNTFAFASGDPSRSEFRVYDEKLRIVFRKDLGWTDCPILCLDPTSEDKRKLSSQLDELMGDKIPKVLVDIIQGFF